MKIGFDAKRAFSNSRGLGNYSRNLISGLTEYFPDNEYVLFGKPPVNGDNYTWWQSVRKNTKLVQPQNSSKIYNAVWRSSLMSKDINRYGIDIYHGLSHEIPTGLKNSSVRKIVTIHDLLFLRFKNNFSPIDIQIYTSKIKYSCRNSDRIIAVSEQTKADLVDYLKVPESKIDVLYQCCSPIYYQRVGEAQLAIVRAKFNLPNEFLLFVGALTKHKNIERIIEAVALLPPSTQLPLVIVGKGKLHKQELQKLVREGGVENRIYFIDYVDQSDMPAIYQSAKILVWPSLFEGFGIPIIEALYSRLPVITSNTGCFSEVGGTNTFYIDPENPQEIASAICQVLTNTDLYTEMQNRGENYAQKFHIKNVSANLIRLYNSIL